MESWSVTLTWSHWERGEIGFTSLIQYLSAEINWFSKLNHIFAPQCLGSWANEITTKYTHISEEEE